MSSERLSKIPPTVGMTILLTFFKLDYISVFETASNLGKTDMINLEAK